MAATWKLEFTEDDLSVVNDLVTRVDISSLVKAGSLRWTNGIDRIGDEPKAGEMSFTLLGRDFEPLNTDSPYYPNVKRWTRFFLSLDHGAGLEDEFVGYARSFKPQWPGNVTHMEIDVVCGDGFDILNKDALPALDPPDATAYEEVVNSDGPSFYYRLGEEAGTKVVSHLRSKRWRRKHPKATRRQKHYRTRQTKAELGGASGPAGTYKNLPTLGEPGLILGDPDTCVQFGALHARGFAGTNGYARVPLDQSDLIDGNRLTVEVWTKALSGSITGMLISGPFGSGAGDSVFFLENDGGDAVFKLYFTDGTALTVRGTAEISIPATPYHVVGAWDGDTAIVYVNGVAVASGTASGKTLRSGSSNEYLRFGIAYDLSNPLGGLNGEAWADESAVYEHALGPNRVLAHFQAGAERGYAEESAIDRITNIALLDADVPWAGINYDANVSFNVQPIMQYGQSRLEEIVAAMAAEGVRTLFFFQGNGEPYYLGWEWMSTQTAFNTVQATFGAPAQGSELTFSENDLTYDDEVYNTLTLSREDGGAVTVANDASITDFGESVAEPISGLLNADDADVADLGAEFLAVYAKPTWTLESLDLNGADEDELAQILDRTIGDLIRFRRRGDDGGPAIDLLTWIIGYEKRIEAGDNLTATWKLARGYNAAEGVWLLGIDGFSELGETTVLA